MTVDASPPTQIVSPSRSTWTRPARPIAVPWAATYDAGSTVPASHIASPAFNEPVTGSSVMPDPAGQNAHLARRVAGGAGADHADVLVQCGEVGPQRQHLLGIAQQQPHPARAVVDPGRVDDLVGGEPQRPGHGLEVGGFDGPGAEQRRGRERQSGSTTQRHQPGAALLHDAVLGRRLAARLQPGVGRADGRVARERQLGAGREDPQPVVGPGVGRGQHEGGLAEVGPPGERLHGVV